MNSNVSQSSGSFNECENNENLDHGKNEGYPNKLSPQDFNNIRAALDLINKNNQTFNTPRHREPGERIFLPPPDYVQPTSCNGLGRSSFDGETRGHFSPSSSSEADVCGNPRFQEDIRLDFLARDGRSSMERNSRSPFLPSNESTGSPHSEGGVLKRRHFTAPYNLEKRFRLPQAARYSDSIPGTSEFYVESLNSPRHHFNEEFPPFSGPSSSFANSPSFPTVNVKRRREFQPFSGQSSFPNSPAFLMEPPSSDVKRRRTCSPQRTLNFPTPKKQSPFIEMSNIIIRIYERHSQTMEDLEQKFALRNQLLQILQEKYRNCGLYIVGSSMNGMGMKKCDMDLCLMLSHSEIDQREAIAILQKVSMLFSRCNFLKDRLVIRAKVPILKFKDIIRGIDLDLNINNAVGIRNTQLLNSYSRIDTRVSPLVIVIKLWARKFDINDAKTNTLSSYSLALMIIHYLQYACKPPVLPCLQIIQPDCYSRESDVSSLTLEEKLPAFVSKNKQTIGELLHGFLNYYANTFNYSNSVISVRTGGILTKNVAIQNSLSPKNLKNHWKCNICIEEPFDLTNTARSVFNESTFEYILSVFRRSWSLLHQTMQINRILEVGTLLNHNR